MQIPPLTFSDTTLLFAIGTIILLITGEMAKTYYGQINLLLNKKKLKNITLITLTLFLIFVAMSILNTILTP